MSEFYDYYHRCETLAEFHFYFDEDDEDEPDDENYIYCLCSRAFIKDGVKTYYADKEYASESDVEVLRDSQSQDWEDHSHVHFSLDTSYKTKCERDEGASCYCSASHTENCCSTDEHDPGQTHGTLSHALQPSDSGADLTYQDYHSDTHEKLERMEQDLPNPATNEDYLSENTWEKFWAINGERLIWASWIKKYSDYINPAYLDVNSDLSVDEKVMPKQHSVDQIFKDQPDTNQKESEDDGMRERKFSYDSKVNPYKKTKNLIDKTEKNNETKEEAWLLIGRRRSCSEHDRILSPKTLAGTDSMTNVTKLTVSSYEATSSHVTSDSTPTDDYSVSSSNSDDQSNDQTRIANIDDKYDNEDLLPSEELDTEQYWQFLWKKHFGEQYAIHYANYIEQHIAQEDLPQINIEVLEEEKKEEKPIDIECENSEGNSQEMPTVIEIQNHVDQIKIEDKVVKKRNKKVSKRYINSVGVLLQNLLRDEQLNSDEVLEAGEGNEKGDNKPQTEVESTTNLTNEHRTVDNSNVNSCSYDDGDDDPPEEPSITLKRSHELDEEDTESENIKNTFQIMGFSLHAENLPKGELIYRKRPARLRPPRYKRFATAKKTYFDEDGNSYTMDQCKESQDECEMQTDDDCADVKSDTEKLKIPTNVPIETEIPHTATDVPEDSVVTTAHSDVNAVEEASRIPLPFEASSKPSEGLAENDMPETATDIPTENQMPHTATAVPTENEIPHTTTDTVVKPGDSDVVEQASTVPLPIVVEGHAHDNKEGKTDEIEGDNIVEGPVTQPVETKRRRRPKRHAKLEREGVDSADLPPEIRDDPKMMKYWKKRHSLFHRFDEGIKLDRESWFSVTPENVAWHIANKYVYDVVLDAFCGAGGNTIQFARTCKKVIAIDIDPVKIEMAKHNAAVYGVADRVEFIVGDFFELAPQLKADMVFLSPPWGGPSYSENSEYDLETMLEPRPASELMSVARMISSTISLYLPRNTRPDQILSLAKEVSGSVEVEQSFLDKRFVAITAYFY